jgi:hypothetical protein
MKRSFPCGDRRSIISPNVTIFAIVLFFVCLLDKKVLISFAATKIRTFFQTTKPFTEKLRKTFAPPLLALDQNATLRK